MPCLGICFSLLQILFKKSFVFKGFKVSTRLLSSHELEMVYLFPAFSSSLEGAWRGSEKDGRGRSMRTRRCGYHDIKTASYQNSRDGNEMMGWECSRAHQRLDYEDRLVEELCGLLRSGFLRQLDCFSWDVHRVSQTNYN